MTAETVTQAVAKREAGPGALIRQYSGDFATVLPSHIRADTWVRVAQGALKRGKKDTTDRSGRTELEVAAANNPACSSPPCSTPPASASNPAPSSTTSPPAR
jgi:recombination protein RecT